MLGHRALWSSLPIVLLLLDSPIAQAQWIADGTPICTARDDQVLPAVVSDGQGGAIIAWQDFRDGSPTSACIYAQRVNAKGVPRWTENGVALCENATGQSAPAMIPDGAGGAILVWQSLRLYAQRIDADGIPQWAAGGVALSNPVTNPSHLSLVSDGEGGAVVAWEQGGFDLDIYAQRVNAAGDLPWGTSGTALCAVPFPQSHPAIASDGAAGAIVAWQDDRSGVPGSADIYAQRVTSSGTAQWDDNGIAVCAALDEQSRPAIVSSGPGGAVVAWQDHRYDFDLVFAQHIDEAGKVQWTPDGIALTPGLFSQLTPRMVSDGKGGAIVTWQDGNPGPDIHAQRVDLSGVPRWTPGGVTLCNASGDQLSVAIVPDGRGGAALAWQDHRAGALNGDIYVKRSTGLGAPLWLANGVALCANSGNQTNPALAPDSSGGAIVVWQDGRNLADSDIYAQRVEFEEGFWGHPEATGVSVADVPGDQGGRVTLAWEASGWDVRYLNTITHYSIWRATDPAAPAADRDGARPEFAGPSPTGGGIRESADRIAPGPDGVEYFWEWVGNQSAQYFNGYSFTAATTMDSTSRGTANHHFQVLSHTSDPFVFWTSNVVGGYSVDNVVPTAPMMLRAERLGSDVRLVWRKVPVSDLRDYAVYRATAPGVTTDPAHFLTSLTDTAWTDAPAPPSPLYYIVTASDVHENQSAPSNEASVASSVGVGGTLPGAALTLLGNIPNPFTAATAIRVGLGVPGTVELDVYDMTGHRVRSQQFAQLGAGWRDLIFEARDQSERALRSGVYVYQVRAGGARAGGKMVLVR